MMLFRAQIKEWSPPQWPIWKVEEIKLDLFFIWGHFGSFLAIFGVFALKTKNGQKGPNKWYQTKKMTSLLKFQRDWRDSEESTHLLSNEVSLVG